MTRATSSFVCRILGWAVGGVGLLIGGCGPVAAGGDDSGVVSTTGVGTPTTSGASSTAGPTGQSEAGAGTTVIVEPTMPTFDGTTAGPGTTGFQFIMPPDGGGLGECDLFAQDCRAGEKCMPYANEGGSSWNDTKCVPVMDDPAQPGEPCFVVGNGVSGVDNCDFGLMCWDTDFENQGTCIAMCKGTPEEPYCESPTAECAVFDSPLNICIEWCDPLVQDCHEGFFCTGYGVGGGFFCTYDQSGDEGQAHDPCDYPEQCDPGLSCVESTAAVECDPAAERCCEPICDLEAIVVCPGIGQVCIPWFEPGTAPPGYEDVGVCSVMM